MVTGSTAFAGNMALGAVDDLGLTERVGHAIGTEALAMGVNVVYAPVLDLATDPANPALGIRSFGDSPEAVGSHGVAMVRGLQAAGVAATVKHAPGMGHISSDTHHGLAVASAERSVLDAREFVPFRAAFAAGARLAMSGHMALPAVTGRDDLPGTLSRAVMTDLLRRDLGFEGVTISDALDMRALAQGPGQVLDVLAAVRAGVDLLLASADPEALARIEETLVRAVARELLDPAEVAATERRVAALRAWLGSAGPAPDLSVVGSDEHQALAAELAARSVTLVRDPGGLLPLIGDPGPILAVMPRPADLTPADTSSTVAPGLAAALRRRFRDVDEIVVEQSPDAGLDRRRSRPCGWGRGRGHRHDRRASPARPARARRSAGRHRHTRRRRRAARPVGRRGVSAGRHGPRHLLDPARLPRCPRGGPRRPGRGAGPPAGRHRACGCGDRATNLMRSAGSSWGDAYGRLFARLRQDRHRETTTSGIRSDSTRIGPVIGHNRLGMSIWPGEGRRPVHDPTRSDTIGS